MFKRNMAASGLNRYRQTAETLGLPVLTSDYNYRQSCIEQLSFCTTSTCLRKVEPLVLVNKIQYSKLKLQHHKNHVLDSKLE